MNSSEEPKWLQGVVVSKAVLKSKAEYSSKSKVRSGRKKKKVKKGPKLSSFNVRCCGKQDTFAYQGKTYCNVCDRSVG